MLFLRTWLCCLAALAVFCFGCSGIGHYHSAGGTTVAGRSIASEANPIDYDTAWQIVTLRMRGSMALLPGVSATPSNLQCPGRCDIEVDAGGRFRTSETRGQISAPDLAALGRAIDDAIAASQVNVSLDYASSCEQVPVVPSTSREIDLTLVHSTPAVSAEANAVSPRTRVVVHAYDAEGGLGVVCAAGSPEDWSALFDKLVELLMAYRAY